MCFRSLLIATPLLTGLFWSIGCAEPRKLQEVDPHLQAAFKLVTTNPDKALDELDLVKKARPAQIEYIRGLVFEKKEELEHAAEAYKRAVQLDPKGTQTRAALARVQILRGRVDEARELLRTVINNDPSDLLSVILLAICAETPQDRSEALALLLAWPEKRPSPKKGQAQVPIRAEYYLTLAAMEKDQVRAENARRNAKGTPLGSEKASFTLVKYAMLRKKSGIARAFLNKLSSAEVQPDQLELIARLSLSLGDLQTTGRALARLPGSIRSLDILTLRGRYELKRGYPRRAIVHLEAARKLASKSQPEVQDELDFNIAQAFHQIGQDDRASAILTALLERSKNYLNAHLLLSEIEFSQGKEKEALQRIQTLRENNPKSTAIWKLLGKLQMKAKDYKAAEQTAIALLQLDPKNTETLLTLADILHLQRKEKEALELVKNAVNESPNDIILLRSLATQFIRLKQPDQALEAVREAPVHQNREVDRTLLLADVYDTLKQPKDANEVLEALVKRAPRSARSWSALARSQRQQNDDAGVEISLRKSIELNPRALKDRARLASLLSKQGKSEEAAQLYTDLANATGKDVVALNNAAMLYAEELDNPARAVQFAEKALALAPTNQSVMDTLAWSLAKRGGKEDLIRAEELLKKARRKLTSAQSGYHYAYVLMKLNKKQQAKSLLEKSLKDSTSEKWHSDATLLLQTIHQ